MSIFGKDIPIGYGYLPMLIISFTLVSANCTQRTWTLSSTGQLAVVSVQTKEYKSRGIPVSMRAILINRKKPQTMFFHFIVQKNGKEVDLVVDPKNLAVDATSNGTLLKEFSTLDKEKGQSKIKGKHLI